MTAVAEHELDVVRDCVKIRGWTSQDQCLELYRSARDAVPRGMNVEIGCYCGRSTLAILRGLRDRGEGDQLIVVDPFEVPPSDPYLKEEWSGFRRPVQDIFFENMDRNGFRGGFSLCVAKSRDAEVKGLVNSTIRFAHLDGDHAYSEVANDLNLLAPHLVEGSIVALDDYGECPGRWGVQEAYEQILKPRVRREWFAKNGHALFVEVAA